MPEPADPIVAMRNVHKSVHEGGTVRPVLAGVDLTVDAGEAVAILGRSGSGKSTLLNLIAGIDDVDAGAIRTAGVDVVAAGERARAALRAQKIGFVFQSFHLLPTLTVAENIALPLELAGHAAAGTGARVAELLARIGLADRAHAWPEVLSGGEQQRVAVGRALATRPCVLLCDEPTGNLDDSSARDVLALLDELRRGHGCALVVVTHSREAAAICDRRLRLEGGVLHAEAEVRP
ncbi:MAG TPA: ABC transporter ATP-binding protein [Planctomycetota bacterium]|nr:ABC transporter ATP-binding protein [Planctomycetota bacterium]